jgi:hypothetical protein
MSGEAESASVPALPHGRYDAGLRRQSVRRGRERGCWLYVPAAELLKAGIDPADPPPFYRLWGTQSGGIMVRLYRER